MISGAYPWMLIMLVPALAVMVYWSVFARKSGIVLPDLTAYKKQFPAKGWRLRVPWAVVLLYTAALLIAVAALARPRAGNERLIIRKQGIDIMLVLDLSGSMQAVDVPRTITTQNALERALKNGEVKDRLAVAKEELEKFINMRPNDRIGLIGFAEYGYNLSPPTLDHDWLIASLAPLKPGVIGDNTGIASAVASGIRRLAQSQSPRRVLILFTDGKNNVSHRLTPLATADLAKEKDVVIYTVGIGGKNAYYLQEGFFGRRFVPYPGEFDEKLLQDMAARTGGKYFRAADAAGMNQIMNEINGLEKTNFEQPRFIEYSEFAPLLCGIALILLCLAAGLEQTVFRSVP